MNIQAVKNEAVIFSKKFMEDENAEFNLQGDYTVQEWYLVLVLSQVYYNLMKGTYTREKAKEEQAKAIKFVIENQNIFEEEE